MTAHPRLSTIQRWWPALGWAALILGMSSVPGSRLDEVGLQLPDKLVHTVEYAVLGALMFRAAARGHSARRALLVAVLFTASVGAIDENYQRLIPQRETSAKDWVADVAGAVIGASLAAGVRGRVRRGQRRS